VTWIDGLALLTLAIAFICGWRAGLIPEFFDAGALVFAALLAGMWSGAFASGLPPTWPLSEAARHLMAFWIVFLFVYAAMRALGFFVEHRRWRGSALVSGIGGGLIASAKVVATLFALLYFALFLPIDSQVRDTLRNSPIANSFDRNYPAINDIVISMSPRLYRPIVRPYMLHHRL
jgi:uncharacterized membrane protein required for colicin V production